MANLISEGKNCVIIKTNNTYILYEKLLNTIHYHSDLNKLIKKEKIVESEKVNTHFKPRKPQTTLESLVLETTTACNFRCDYCIYSGKYSEKRVHGNEFMTFEIAKPFVDYFIKNRKKNSYVGFYGGEPLLNIELIEKVIAYVRNKTKDVVFSIATNGALLEDNFEKLNKSHILWNISLDGPKKIHNKQRISDVDSFESIKNLTKKNNLVSNITFNVTISELEKTNEIYDFFSVKPFSIYPLNVSFIETRFLDEPRSTISAEKTNEILETLKKHFINNLSKEQNNLFLQSLFNKSLSRLLNRKRDAIAPVQNVTACDVAERKIYASVNGITYPCEKTERMFEIGNFENVVDFNKINQYLDELACLRTNICGSCWYSRICQICPAHSTDLSSEKILKQSCALMKSEFLEGLDLYVRIMSQSDLASKFVLKKL